MVDIQNETAPEVQGTTRADTRQAIDFHYKDTNNIPIMQYRRVGDKYEKTITNYDIEGRPYEDIITLSKESIVDTHGKDFLHRIPLYDAHCIVPSHTDFKQVVGRCWNLYRPIEQRPTQGEHRAWDALMQRVFGSQEAIGWDYLTIMYRHPTHNLPVLCLVSKDNHTGKSTFGNALSYLFGLNVGFFTQDDLTSSFNQWIKHLVAVFEEISETKHTLNKIKAMATAKMATLNEKHLRQVKFQPFVKLIILSNNDSTFIKANREDQRYWIRKLAPMSQEEYDKDFDAKLREETPAVLYTLANREITTPKQSRMWVAPSLIATEALDKVRNESRADVVKDLEIVIDELLAEMPYFHATIGDFVELLKNKYPQNVIKKALNEDFGVYPTPKSIRFKSVRGTSQFEKPSRTGTPYLFKRKDVNEEDVKEEPDPYDENTPF